MISRLLRHGLWGAVLLGGFVPLHAYTPQPAQENPQAQLDAALQRFGQHPPPPPFGEAEVAESKRLRDQVAKRRDELFNPKIDPTDAQLAQASAELQPAFDRLRTLNQQSRTWAAYQANPTGEWWRDAEADSYALAAAGPIEATPLDLVAFYVAAKRLQVFEYFLATNQEGLRQKYAYPLSTVQEALAIARALEPFEQGRIEIGGHGAASGGVGSYQLRAGYLRARALTLAAFMSLNEGKADQARSLWRQAIDLLHKVEVVFKIARQTGTNPDALAHLPKVNPALLAQLRSANPHAFIALNWDDFTHRIGLELGGITASSTATDTAKLLEFVCPWSPPVFALLEDLGQLQNIDLRVLRVRDFGTSSRNGLEIKDQQKIWVGSLGPAAIPPNVRRDLEEMRNGIVPGSGHYLDWRNLQGAEELTVWVVSPTVRDLSAGDFLGTASKLLTLYTGGALAIAADIAGDLIGKAAEQIAPNNLPAQIGIGIGAESVPYEIVSGDHGLELKREGFNPIAMVKGALLAVLSALEQAEMEALFEGLDPASDTFDQRTNRSVSYVGGWLPPVILRAQVVGWEKAEPNEYMRLRIYTRYWVFDPAGLTGEGKAFDLQTQLVDSLPGAASLRAGDVSASEKIWQPLPWSKTPEGWGSRVRTVALQPMTQTLRVQVPQKLEQQWRADCPEGEDLCVVLRYGPNVDRGPDVVPLGDPLRFSDPGYAAAEGLQTGFKARHLYAAYDAHILRAKRSGNDFDIDSATAVELASFPLRLTQSQDAPITGTLEGDDEGIHVELNFTYEGRPRRSFNLEPDSSGAASMPGLLVMRCMYDKGIDLFEVPYYWDRFEFSMAYVPAEMDSWYQLDVRVVSKESAVDTQYQLHAFNRDFAGAAVFVGKIPIPYGRSEIYFKVNGAKPSAQRKIIVQRPVRSGLDDIDIAKHEGFVREDLEEREQADDEQAWLREHCSYLGSKLRLAEAHMKLYQWTQARNTLHEIAREWPDTKRVTEEYVQGYYDGIYHRYNEYLMKVALRQGDAMAMGPAAANYLAMEWRWMDEKNDKDRYARDRYQELSRKYASAIDDYISLGGGEAMTALLERWRELRRLSKMARPEDATRFKLGGQYL